MKPTNSTDPLLFSRIRVKFLAKAYRPKYLNHWLARFPASKPQMGRCDFIFDQDSGSYDWLVVYDDFPPRAGERRTLWEEPLACSHAHTLLITTEPSSVKVYEPAFTRQFAHVITSQEPWALAHPGACYTQPGLIWYYGATGHGNVVISARGSYDAIVSYTPTAKIKPISTVCSSKQMTHTLHAARNAFVRKLQAALPELDVFGHGVRYVEDKADTLDPYECHIAIENHVCPHHWTEKLGDSFLGACLPLYHGCPNYMDYFPPESLIPINIHQFEHSQEIIRKALMDHEHRKRLPAILESRQRYLERYALFAQISRLVESWHEATAPARELPTVICSRHLLRKRSWRSGFQTAWHKLGVKLRLRTIAREQRRADRTFQNI